MDLQETGGAGAGRSQSGRFDTEFRKRLIMSMCADPDFFRKASDFLVPEMIVERPVRFAYEVLMRCYRVEGRLPTPEVLQMAAIDDLKNQEIPFEQRPAPEEMDEYLSAVSMASVGLSLKSTDRTPYMSSRLKDFLQMCYVAAIPDDATPSKRLELYSQIYSQMQSYDTAEADNSMTLEEALSKMGETIDIRNRIGTGLSCVDVPINGGLAPGEIGLILGGSGTGKSNSMLNFAVENALRGNQSCYISLELSMPVILSRLIAMFTGIKASVISKGVSKKAMEKWTESERKRYFDLTTPGGKNWHLLNSIKILTHTDGRVTTDTIKRDVKEWKEEKVKEGHEESKIGLVFVDWLNNIDPSSLTMVGKNSNQAYVMEKVTEALRQVGVATKTRVWTAQQVSRGALNKEVLTMQDGRDSSGTFNPVDLALGISIKKEAGADGKSAPRISDGKTGVKVDPDRDMLWSVIKDRNSGATGACIKFYQGASLRFFESKKEFQRVDLINRSVR